MLMFTKNKGERFKLGKNLIIKVSKPDLLIMEVDGQQTRKCVREMQKIRFEAFSDISLQVMAIGESHVSFGLVAPSAILSQFLSESGY